MDYEEISDEEWSLLAPMLCIPLSAGIVRRGRPRIQPRVLANAILWVLTIGGSWSKLPARYPSSPTCRCRFEEWRRDGKLDEMVRILSSAGRKFLYVPDSAYPQENTTLDRGALSIDEHGLRRVLWRSQGSWHASHGPVVNGSIDPCNTSTQTRAAIEAVSLPGGLAGHATAGNLAHDHCDASAHRAFWMGLASKGTTVTDTKGYVVYVAVDPVRGAMFRGWTEIMRDGKRVARSGLVGPKFYDPEACMQFALAWARRWIELNANPTRIHDESSVYSDDWRAPLP